MTYTIAVAPSTEPGKFTATSSDGHAFTTSEPLFAGARYWQALGAPSSASIVTVWSSGPGHWSAKNECLFPSRMARQSRLFRTGVDQQKATPPAPLAGRKARPS